METYGIIVRAELADNQDPNIFTVTPAKYKDYNAAGKKLEMLDVPGVENLRFMQLAYFYVGEDFYGKDHGYITCDFMLIGETDMDPEGFMNVMEAAIVNEIENASPDDRTSGTHISSFSGLRLYHFNRVDYMDFVERRVPTSTPGYRAAAKEAAESRKLYSFDESDTDASSDEGAEESSALQF